LSNSVSIILLSYNRPAYLAQALPSLLRQTHKNLEIIVVDNQSASSEEIGRIVGEHPSVKLIRNSLNLGFAGGMNTGLREASGEYVYLTEDDVIVEENCISMLVEYMTSNPTTGLAAPIMYNMSDRTIKCAGGNFALDAIYRKKIFGEGENDTGQFDQSFDVDFIPGAAIFGRLELLTRLNGFREDFFMYSEDTELCIRVLKSGLKITVVPQAHIYHFEPSIALLNQEIEFHKLKNFFSLYLLHAPLRVLPEFYLRYGLINFLRALVSNRKIVWPTTRAFGWFLFKSPSLILDRLRDANS
jgi:GT2 family glycosyltransferase